MSEIVRTFIVFAGITIAAILIMEAARLVLEAMRLHRTELNSELQEANRRLRYENGDLMDRMSGMDAERRVHNATVGTLKDKIAILEKENEDLKAGMPVCTGYRFVK